MKYAARVLALGCVGVCGSSVGAQLVYSHFQVPPAIQSVVTPDWEVGEYVTLAGGAQQLAAVELEFGALSSAPNGTGTIAVKFYQDGGGVPGVLIQSYSQAVNLIGIGPRRVAFSLGFAVPSPLWVTVRFVESSGGTAGVIMSDGPAMVGTLSPTRVFRLGGAGAWGSTAATEWMTMRLTAPPAPCYANCDHSAIIPILNANDFICFLMSYAAGSMYANCDGSTAAPVLNVNDFVCFQTRFAGGCE